MNENKYAVIGYSYLGDKQEHWYGRFYTSMIVQQLFLYAQKYAPFYEKIEIWIVDQNDNKLELVGKVS